HYYCCSYRTGSTYLF
nr:immunoglobulin light chain junction region [Macaca mulatta]MOX76282.1 immunoglobulin light chain junction region [Macaca mulatta]